MKRKLEVEATLERSLRKQVSVPLLDRSFDAKVWARIEAEESRNTVSTMRAPARAIPKTARWLYIINVLGLASAAIVACAFGAQMFAGVDTTISLPEISQATRERILPLMSQGFAGVALVFGLMYTPWGRRLREELN
jgi:negative regulator of sigma E activity